MLRCSSKISTVVIYFLSLLLTVPVKKSKSFLFYKM
jgi:hypothetical protein